MPKTIKTTVYLYDELEESAKGRALEWADEFATDYEWWDFDGLTGFTTEECKQYRIAITDSDDMLKYKRIYFDLDHGGYLQFVEPHFADDETARKFLRVPRRTWSKVEWYFPTPLREANTTIDFEPFEDLTDHEETILRNACERFSAKVAECLSALRRGYEYLHSREALEETIRANEYTFTQDGKRFG